MNKEDALKRLAVIEREARELKKIIDSPADWRDELPSKEMGRGCHYISADRQLGYRYILEINHEQRRPEFLFTSKKDAQIVIDKILLMQEMHAFASLKNEGWIPNWDSNSERKWGVVYAFGKAIYNDTYWNNIFVFGIAVKSRDIAEEMLNEFGERVKQVYNIQY